MYLINTDLNEKQTIFLALTKVLGISFPTSKKICNSLGFSVYMNMEDLSKRQLSSMLETVNRLNVITSHDLIKKLSFDKDLLISIKCYRGMRLYGKLPARGQRTHTNSKTCKKFLHF